MSSENVNWEAVARYLAGESPAEEQARVQRWLSDNPADARVITALDDALGRLTLGPDAEKGIDVDAALAKVKAMREEPALRAINGGAVKRMEFSKRRSSKWILAAAAAVVIAVARSCGAVR